MKDTYGIIIDLDDEMLKKLYPDSSFQNAYNEIRLFLEERGFIWKSHSFYYGNGKTSVQTILICREMSKKFEWLYPSTKKIEMIRISENNDLMEAIKQ